MRQVDGVGAVLREAIAKAIKRGLSVAPGDCGVGRNPASGRWAPQKASKKRICPIGAVLLAKQPTGTDSPPVAAAAALGIQLWELIGIQVGFDAAPCAEAWPEREYTELGRALREEYVVI